MPSRIPVRIVWKIIDIPEILKHIESFCDHEVGRGRTNRSRRRTAEERDKKTQTEGRALEGKRNL